VWASGFRDKQLSDPGLNADDPDVASSPTQDSAIVVFEQVDADSQNIRAARINRGGTFSAGVVISDKTSAASSPTVALDGVGGALAAWTQVVAGRNHVVAAVFTAAAGWQPPQILSDVALGDVSVPTVALEPGGNGFVVWVQARAPDSQEFDAWVARYIAGRGFSAGNRSKLSQTAGVANVRPSVGVDREGRAFACWIEAGGIWISRFE
jgi:hypothetical protein